MAYQYLPIEQAKPGDIVECTAESNSHFTKGKLYIVSTNISKFDSVNTIMITLDDIGSTINGWGKKNFKLVKTKPGSEAKVGDTVICVKDTGGSCSLLDTFKVAKVTANSLYPQNGTQLSKCVIKPGWNWSRKCFLVLCQTESITSFQAWLESKGAWEKYKANCANLFEKTISIGASNWVSYSFTWSHTPEGADYWRKLSKEWRELSLTIPFFEPSDEEIKPDTAIEGGTNQIQKEIIMNDDICIKVPASAVQQQVKAVKPKTDIQNSKKVIGETYNEDGSLYRKEYFKTIAKAKASLQRHTRIGKTIKIYKLEITATTDIPVVEIKA